MELLIYGFVGVVSAFGIFSIKDINFFGKITIQSIVFLSILTAITVPLMVLSMLIKEDMSLGFLMLSMFFCEALRIGAFYMEWKINKQDEEKRKRNNDSIYQIHGWSKENKNSKNKRAI